MNFRSVVGLGVLLLSSSTALCLSVRDLGPLDLSLSPTLNLSFRNLTSLEGLNELEGRQYIEMLLLNNNSLSTVPVEMFDGFTNLRDIDLSNNPLSLQQIEALRSALPGVTVVFAMRTPVPALTSGRIVLQPNFTDAELLTLSPAGQEKATDECSICLEQTGPQGEGYLSYVTTCGHYFHPSCLSDVVNTSRTTACPLCRRDIFTGGQSQRLPSQPTPMAQASTSKKKHTKVAARKTKSKHAQAA